ncbi:MAG TPA: hypothetical protein VHI93_01445 [Candidatus Thermoplasmatota archaeon]|nr:hypothetical protein [Candidatus Thermoplasmatota archaeon]
MNIGIRGRADNAAFRALQRGRLGFARHLHRVGQAMARAAVERAMRPLLATGMVVHTTNSGFDVHAYGVPEDPNEDATAGLQAALNAANAAGGGAVVLRSRRYRYTSLTLYPGVWIQGQGWTRQGGGNGTRLVRIANSVGLALAGTSVGGGGGSHKRSPALRDLYLDGGGYAADLCQFSYVDFLQFQNVHVGSCAGRAIKLVEVFDSRFLNVNFDSCGSATLPVVELNSPSEFTNQIHFTNCDFESYAGTCILTSGSNTNECYFVSCKFESTLSNTYHIDLQGAANFAFVTCAFTSRGTAGQTIPAQVRLVGCSGISFVRCLHEHPGTVGVDAAAITTYVSIATTDSVSIDSEFLNADKVTGAMVTSDGNNSDSTSVRGTTPGVTTKDVLAGLTFERTFRRPIYVKTRASEPSFRFKREDANDSWYLGRCDISGSSSRWKIIHEVSGAETDALRIGTDNKVSTPVGFKADTIEEVTPGAGVTSDGVKAKDGYIVPSATAGESGAIGVTGGDAYVHDGVAARKIQDAADKAVANGIATLDAGAKVPLAQLSEVLATSDLTDLSGAVNTANGTVKLDAGAKVPAAQLPAAGLAAVGAVLKAAAVADPAAITAADVDTSAARLTDVQALRATLIAFIDSLQAAGVIA